MKLKLGAGLLIFIGLLQLTGDLFGWKTIRAIGLAAHASPAPKVFTAQEGFETYSGKFYILWTDHHGIQHGKQITPAVYRNIEGPYNRRNAYGAALSYAPILHANEATREMHDSVLKYALCKKGSLLKELKIDPNQIQGNVHLKIVPRQILPDNHTWKLDYEIICTQ